MLFVFVPLSHKYGGAFPVCGSGALSESMERCILHYGGTVLTSSRVEKVIVQGGEAKGVIGRDTCHKGGYFESECETDTGSCGGGESAGNICNEFEEPVKNFWMCGPSTHPGIGVTGGGRAAAQAIMEAIGVDFEKAIAK